MSRAGQAYYLHADHQGSIVRVTDAAGAVVNSYAYDAYGRRIAATEGVAIAYGYTVREYDAESGLMYYRARMYDPATGRFLQTDPFGFAAGDLNVYRYVGNDPVNAIDPDGVTKITGGISIVVPLGDIVVGGGVSVSVDLTNGEIGISDSVSVGVGDAIGADFEFDIDPDPKPKGTTSDFNVTASATAQYELALGLATSDMSVGVQSDLKAPAPNITIVCDLVPTLKQSGNILDIISGKGGTVKVGAGVGVQAKVEAEASVNIALKDIAKAVNDLVK
jgi:RHS repeat-associated protein